MAEVARKEVSVKITRKEEGNRWFEIGAYVAIVEGMLKSEIKRRNRGDEKERRTVEEKRKRGEKEE